MAKLLKRRSEQEHADLIVSFSNQEGEELMTPTVRFHFAKNKIDV